MDVVSSVAAVVGLVFNFATAIKKCHDVHAQYRDAGRIISSIRHELETLQAALQELANLMMHDASALSSRWDSSKTLPMTFRRALRGFDGTIKDLLKTLGRLSGEKLGRIDKVKVVWNENEMREHQRQLEGQTNALQLLLQVLQTGSISDVKDNLRSIEAALVQLSVVSKNSVDHSGQDISSNYVLDDQEDLLDLDWSDAVPTVELEAASGYAEDLRKELTPMSESMTLCNRKASSTLQDGEERSQDLSLPIISSIPESEKISTCSGDLSKVDARRTETMAESRTTSATKRVERRSTNEQQTTMLTSSQQDNQRGPRTEPLNEPHSTTIKSSSKPLSVLPTVISATIKRDLEGLRHALKCLQDIDALDPRSWRTALMYAAILGYDEILELLLKSGADISAQDRDCRTALHYAAREGQSACIRTLIFHGAAGDIEDTFGDVPFHLACHSGRIEAIRLFLEENPNIIEIRTRTNGNAYHIVAASWNQKVIRLIHSHVQGLSHPDSSTNSESSIQSIMENRTMAMLLEEKDCFGQTPLSIAIHLHNEQATETFIRLGAAYNAICLEHQKCLLQEALERFTDSLLDSLTLPSRFPDLDSAAGRFLLRKSSESEKWGVTRTLVEQASAKSSPATVGRTLDEEQTLVAAIDFKAVEEVEFLLGHGASIISKIYPPGGSWYLPVHHAVCNNDVAMLKILTKHGADLLSQTSHGWSPLYLSIHAVDDDSLIEWVFEETHNAVNKMRTSGSKPVNSWDSQEGRLILGGAIQACCSYDTTNKIELILRLIHEKVGQQHLYAVEALLCAVAFGRTAIIQYLLDRGADPRKRFPYHEKMNMITGVMFFKIEDSSRPGNKVEDYETCKKMVQGAIDRLDASDEVDRKEREKTTRRAAESKNLERRKHKVPSRSKRT